MTWMPWREWCQEVDDVLDAGEEKVVVLVRLLARGRERGAAGEQPWAMVVTVRDGKLISSRTFLDGDNVLASAVLS
jgi:ketosteroid isomerase-like protein